MSLKWIALTLMLLQNAAFVLVMRYSRQQQATVEAVRYNVSMVVVMQELFKLMLCYTLQAWTLRAPIRSAMLVLQPRELSDLAIPGLCFTLQNNILYIALSNLDPLVFQITYQIKTILTALLSVKMLGKVFTQWQWVSQIILVVGIVMVQMSEQHQRAAADGTKESSKQHILLGLAAVFVAAFSSSFASVYFERLLKGSRQATTHPRV
jgi:solute carrier family 35 (UDP-sugar transporter), member A1/2/3